MPSFSEKSRKNLDTCDPLLKFLFNEVILHFDCTILQGHRGEKEQNKLKLEGKSKLNYPMSKHNVIPSLAVDVAPYPIDWDDVERFDYFAGFVKGIASQMGINIRWGGDWDSDTQLSDNRFNDLPHFELVK